jgi:hypothetical protein
LNMFTGVVVESFAYIYQMPGGASLNREEMSKLIIIVRYGALITFCSGSFKKLWSEFDRERTGYVKRKDFVRFCSVSTD